MRSPSGETPGCFSNVIWKTTGETLRCFQRMMEIDNVATIQKNLSHGNLGVTVIARSAV